MTSPPIFFFFASFPVITPIDVDMIDTPKPFKILGILLALEYFLNPGVEMRSIFLIIDSPVLTSYFKAILIFPCLFEVSINL